MRPEAIHEDQSISLSLLLTHLCNLLVFVSAKHSMGISVYSAVRFESLDPFSGLCGGCRAPRWDLAAQGKHIAFIRPADHEHYS